MDPPGYWMNETSGVLKPAVDRYIRREALSKDDIVVLRAYLRQWINAPCWDANPYAIDESRQSLTRLRGRIDFLISRSAIDAWLGDALMEGIDPL